MGPLTAPAFNPERNQSIPDQARSVGSSALCERRSSDMCLALSRSFACQMYRLEDFQAQQPSWLLRKPPPNTDRMGLNLISASRGIEDYGEDEEEINERDRLGAWCSTVILL